MAADPQARLLVAVGDSITDGVGSTDDRNMRWPDALAERLRADQKLASIAVVNSGISGNRILNDGFERFIGPSVLSRFERDVLKKPGVRWVILMSGGNDISAANVLPRPQDQVTAEQIIEGMKKLIARAHANGVEIWGATLSPRAGTKPPFYSEAGEAKRRAVNAWIRTSGAFDACSISNASSRIPRGPMRCAPSTTAAITCTPMTLDSAPWRMRSICVCSIGRAERTIDPATAAPGRLRQTSTSSAGAETRRPAKPVAVG